MNSLFLGFGAIIIFLVAYRFYGRILERLFDTNPENKTPAHYKFDGVDYVPAKNWLVLFGHHFSSIAGAGPILGPVIACAVWGWGPAILWIILGSIFVGGVHDFTSLMVSLRNDGRSIGDTTEATMGTRAKIIFSLFVWLALVLVIAVFAASAAKTLQTTPEIVIPTFGIIPIAILVGLMLYRWHVNAIIATIVGVGLLFVSIILGLYFPIKWTYLGWLFALLIAYAYTASILPVNIILQPRDYLSFFVLIFGLVVGYLGVIITHPNINTPTFVSFRGTEGYLFPMMFVTIACGAISGFHSLVASGTTSKQLNNERDAKRIGYGAMLTEGVLSVLAIITVCGGLYWYGGNEGFVYPELIKGGNWIGAFGKGYGQVTKPILGTLGLFIGITMLKTFIVTTLDTATRITRYIGTELFGEKLGIGFMKNMYINSAIVIGVATYLAVGPWQSIWPVFGASNQLVAALALLVVTTWLLSKKKGGLYTLIPAIFMLLVTITALILQAIKFFSTQKIMLGVISVILLILAGFMIEETLRSIVKLKEA
ncbi:MAG: carbon starvation protein A [candidate division WOR-3 bacterium]|nr:carbon starvation protein A [candidate division WOR-3 bacterium]